MARNGKMSGRGIHDGLTQFCCHGVRVTGQAGYEFTIWNYVLHEFGVTTIAWRGSACPVSL
jgi:hypothetical protein